MFGETTGGVRTLLRVEGLCVLAGSCLAYSRFGAGWGLFALFFFTPDISFLGYLASPGVGATSYNTAHSYVGALICLVLGAAFSFHVLVTAGIIWCAHIGFDRALGYGLKYSAGFGFTHLGLIGAARKGAAPEQSLLSTESGA